jgi:Ca2+-binding EF-hand superfamily protein
MLELPGVMLEFVAENSPVNTSNYNSYANRIVMSFDKDKNGYLEKSELPQQQQGQFAGWDIDGNGKVFLEEIKEAYRVAQAANFQRVTFAGAQQQNVLFSVLDSTGDGRLGLREMRGAAKQLQSIDRDGDGQISAEEVPHTIRFVAGRGSYGYQLLVNRNGVYRVGRTGERSPSGPKWFLHMDRNGDGDITPREFLGEEKQFASLDRDGDGFIDSNEAQAATESE